MNDTLMQSATLHRLYTARFGEDMAYNLVELCKEQGWEESTYWKLVDRLQDKGLVAGFAMGGSYIITPIGIHFAEENSLVDERLKQKNRLIRSLVLEKLSGAYDASGTSPYEVDFRELAKQIDMDPHLVLCNIEWLENFMLVKGVGAGYVKITSEGYLSELERRKQVGLYNEFEQVAALNPHARGRAFQKLFARLVEEHGWTQEEGVRTSNEEMDVMIHRGREYFMVECKWEKEPIEAGVVREFYGKLDNRIGVQGVLVSMSGFTVGAVDAAEKFLHSKVILFFGPNDVLCLLSRQQAFDDLLNSKYQQIVTRHQVQFD